MKKTLFIAIALMLGCTLSALAQKQTEASELNLIGRPFSQTPNPYHRVDTLVYKGFTVLENKQLRCPAGMAVLFKTNSRSLKVTTQWGDILPTLATSPIAYKGYDLYIKNADGEWQYAACGASKSFKSGDKSDTFTLISNMDGTMHECMMYMPMCSEVLSCKIVTDEGAVIEPLESEFRHRIVAYGSSFTHGTGINRSGMSYIMQFMRNTGLQMVSFGMGGRCLMQPYIADVLVDVKADAFLFDTFSNPNAKLIRERLIPFIDRMIAAHPGVPLIFQRTIYREQRSFDTALDAREREKAKTVEELFKTILSNPKYKDVYLITPNASERHATSADGTHPGSYGYTLWAESIEKPVLKILKKYGIK